VEWREGRREEGRKEGRKEGRSEGRKVWFNINLQCLVYR
jgi:hypothetical protein